MRGTKKYRRGEGVSLLEHDEVKRVSEVQELESLDLAGALNILWTITGMGASRTDSVSYVRIERISRCGSSIHVFLNTKLLDFGLRGPNFPLSHHCSRSRLKPWDIKSCPHTSTSFLVCIAYATIYAALPCRHEDLVSFYLPVVS